MSAQDLYPFTNPQAAERFSRLTHEVRCLVCQNQSIADSNAELANDMRTKVYQLMQKGRSEQQIKTYLVDRYGDYVLFKPPVEAATSVLWALPLLLMLVAIGVVTSLVRHNRKKTQEVQS